MHKVRFLAVVSILFVSINDVYSEQSCLKTLKNIDDVSEVLKCLETRVEDIPKQIVQEELRNRLYRPIVSGLYKVKQKDATGEKREDLGSTSNRICFLTRVKFEDLDSEEEWAECEVAQESDRWVLRAYLKKGPDAKAYCDARCISWQ